MPKIQQKQAVECSIACFLNGARDGTRTHTAKPHAPQTCLSTIPTLSQLLKYYTYKTAICQHEKRACTSPFFMISELCPEALCFCSCNSCLRERAASFPYRFLLRNFSVYRPIPSFLKKLLRSHTFLREKDGDNLGIFI